MKLEVNAADDAMPPVEAEVTVDGEANSLALPTTLMLKAGSEVVIDAVPANSVDYAITGWSDGTEGGKITFTVSGETTLTVMPSFPNSRAATRVRPRMASFAEP